MENKNNRLKSVLIVLSTYIILTALLYPLGEPKSCDFICFPYWSLPTIIPAAAIGRLIGLLPFGIEYTSMFFIFLSAIIFYISFGIIAVLIYEKMKK